MSGAKSIRSVTRGRGAVALAFALLAVALAAGYVATGSITRAWHFLGVPSLSPTFGDLATITTSIDCAKLGQNPYTSTECTPLHRAFNYPSIWLKLGLFGVTFAWNNAIGVLFAVSLVAALLLIFETQSMVSGAISFAAVISPATLLAVERGNIDIVNFVLIVFSAVILLRWRSTASVVVNAAVIAFLTLLKYYPIAAISSFLHRKHGLLGIAATVVLTIVGLFAFSSLQEIKTVGANTPHEMLLTYGDMPIFLLASAHVSALSKLRPDQIRVMGGVCALVLAAAAALLAWRRPAIVRRFLPPLDAASPTGSIAISSASIFCFTFLIGSNFDYRLIFLLGILPVLLVAYDAGPSLHTLIAPATIAIFLWSGEVSRISSRFYLLEVPVEVIDWVVFIGGAAWLALFLFHPRRDADASVPAAA